MTAAPAPSPAEQREIDRFGIFAEEEIAAAITRGDFMVCLTRCESCQFGCHYDEPTWHTWAGDEDIEHAAATGQPDPRSQRCGCDCAKTPVQ